MDVTTPSTLSRPPASIRRDLSSGLAFAWILAALVGAGTISAFAERPALRLVAPIAVMLSYLYYGYNSPGRNTTKLADSVYFLGFLWTLYALVNEFVFRHGAATNPDSVYRVFGYAVVTTAFGMFCRLALLQFHETASDQMEQAQDELDIELERFVEQMRASSEQLSDWRLKSAEALNQFDLELRAATTAIPETIRIVHTESAKAIAETLKEAVSPLIAEMKEIAALTRKMKTATSNLERTMTQTGETLTDVSTTFADKMSGAVDSAEKTVSATLTAAGTRLAETARQYATALQTEVEVATKAVHALTDAQTKIGAFFEGVRTSVTAIGADVDAARRQTDELRRSITQTEGAVVTAGSDAARRIETSSGEVVKTISEAATKATALNQTLDEVVEFVRSKVM